MSAPDMRVVLSGMIGQTVRTVAQERPNTIISLTQTRVLVETVEGHRNYASVHELQELADRVYGERRSRFRCAVGAPSIWRSSSSCPKSTSRRIRDDCGSGTRQVHST